MLPGKQNYTQIGSPRYQYLHLLKLDLETSHLPEAIWEEMASVTKLT